MRVFHSLSVSAFLALAACSDKGSQPEDSGLLDADGDGVPVTEDCDDNNPDAAPGLTEVCDGIDNDCDGFADEDGATGGDTFYADQDGDGYGDPDAPSTACSAPPGAVSDDSDCDDSSDLIHPGAVEDDCTDSTDYNCDGSVAYADADADGYPACQDCDDGDESINPAGVERCDGQDNDCDLDVDEDDAADAPAWYRDADEDGYGDPDNAFVACEAPTGYVEDALDCDDDDSAQHPEADELCNEEDDDCDGTTDEDDATDAPTWYLDGDEDGFGDAASTTRACAVPAGYTELDTDCDDTDSTQHPDADERCNEEDDDCDATIDEDDAIDALTWFRDLDEDGFGDSDTTTAACAQPPGYVDDDTDCDDLVNSVYPGADELCDGVDDDCDAVIDEDDAVDASLWYLDDDGDGFGDPDLSTPACSRPSGYLSDDTDCDDGDADQHPGADEYCNGEDDDCDSTTDEDDAVDASTWYADSDGDSYGDAAAPTLSCALPADYVDDADDCDDTDDAQYPGADEYCNGEDDDCDRTTDEDDALDAGTWFGDADDDGYGTDAITDVSCEPAPGFVALDTDCDDDDVSQFPGADERCNGEDDDCDSTTDEDDAVDALPWYADTDDDGFGDPGALHAACSVPTGYLADNTDCDDTDDAQHPGADEYCNGEDDDCDRTTDEDDAVDAPTWYADTDHDGYGDLSATHLACSVPSGYVGDHTDCDDTDSAQHPGADEYCDGEDDDCDSTVDEDDAVDVPTWYRDADGDGYGDASLPLVTCYAPSGYVAPATDCDDGEYTTNPRAPELCEDGVDNNCDGLSNSCAPSGTQDLSEGDALLLGETRSDYSGKTLANAGDVNGDGFDDVLIGAEGNDAGGVSAGASYLVLGPFSGSAVLSAADARMVGQASSDGSAKALDGAGDLDGDGYDDVIIGAEGNDAAASSAGAGYVVLGPITGRFSLSAADARLLGIASNDYAGSDVGLGGDLNGDGLGDALIGARGSDLGGSFSGAVWVTYGAPSSGSLTDADATIYGSAASDYAATPDGAGDVDGDGIDDLLVGAYGADGGGSSSGEAYLFLGPVSGSMGTSDADGTLIGESSADYAGTAVAAGGDLNGDGYADLLVGAYGNDAGASSAGAAYVVLGPFSGTRDLADVNARLKGVVKNDYAGFSLDGAGDVDGDGFDDVVVGAYQSDTGGTDAGAAYLCLGPISGSVSLSTAELTVNGEVASDYAGYAVSAAGDTDGDGKMDLLIGAYGDDTVDSSTGASILVLGTGL